MLVSNGGCEGSSFSEADAMEVADAVSLLFHFMMRRSTPLFLLLHTDQVTRMLRVFRCVKRMNVCGRVIVLV